MYSLVEVILVITSKNEKSKKKLIHYERKHNKFLTKNF